MVVTANVRLLVPQGSRSALVMASLSVALDLNLLLIPAQKLTDRAPQETLFQTRNVLLSQTLALMTRPWAGMRRGENCGRRLTFKQKKGCGKRPGRGRGWATLQ